MKNLKVKKILVSLIIFILVYAHGAITINTIASNILSYSINGIETVINESEETMPVENVQETEEATKIELIRDSICKTDMEGVAYEYLQNIKINLTNSEAKQIEISDISNTFYKGEMALEEEIEHFYKKTKLLKQELINILGETGKIEIKDKETLISILNIGKTEITSTEELEDGEIIQTIKFQEEETNQEIIVANIKNYQEYIEIEYVEKIKEIEAIITYTEINESENKILNIESTKEIGIIESTILEEITKLNSKISYKEFANIGDETEEFQTEINEDTEIKERATKAEIAINKQELSTTVINEVQFTITLFTESKMYDLFKNPTFKIELPEYVQEISTISEEDIVILNNKTTNGEEEIDIFTNLTVDQKEENGKKYIELTMQGEQQNLSLDEINNVQIVIPAQIATSKLQPTTESQINLYYSNENKTTYEVESTVMEGFGENNIEIKFIAVTGIITKTKITVGEQSVENYQTEEKSLILPSRENNAGIVEITAVNNKNQTITDAKILGHSENLGEITIQNATVKYSTESNATLETEDWQTTYQEGVKSYLIELGSIEQGTKVEYTYNINLPEVSEDTTFIEEYTMFDGETQQIARETAIELKTVKLDVELNSSVGENAIYGGQEFNYEVEITNQGTNKVEEIGIEVTLPEGIETVEEAPTSWENITLEAGETITKIIKVKAPEVQEETIITSKVTVQAKYLEGSIEKTITNTIQVIDIEASLSTYISKNSITIENVEIGSVLNYAINLSNKSEDTKNITLKVELPECVDMESILTEILVRIPETIFWEPEEGTEISIEGNIATIPVTLLANEQKCVNITLRVEEYISKEVRTKVRVKCGEEEIILEDIQIANSPVDITVEKAVYKDDTEILTEEIELTQEEELKYELKIKNSGETAETINIETEISQVLEVKEISCISIEDNIIIPEEDITNSFEITGITLGENEEATLTVKAMLKEEIQETTDIISTFNITGTEIQEIEIVISNNVEIAPENPENPENPTDPEQPEDPENPIEEYNIAGVAWLDENENGAREESEELLEGINVSLLNNRNIVIEETQTNRDGKYTFTSIEEGDYIIVFEYDKNEYKLTEPKKEGVSENLNSDAYESTLGELTQIKTDKLALTKNLENIDIGLIERGTFELSVEKTINKITVKNNEENKVIDYNSSKLAKIEIPAKSYIGTNLIIEYDIVIANKGSVAGYVYSLKDILPEGIEFVSELNTDWYEEDGNLYSVVLTQEEIKPGETKTLKVIGTKEIKEDEAERIINKAEIIETFNEMLLEEKDKTNNTSQAELLITVKTGQARTYILVIAISLSIIAIGVYIIQKKVLRN